MQVSQELDKITALRKTLEEDQLNLQQQKKELLNKSKQEAKQILLSAKEEASNIIKEMHNISDNKELENQRNKLNKKIKDIKIDNSFSNSNITTETLNLEDIIPNTKVFVSSLNKDGVIVSHISKSNQVQVQIGSLKMNVPISDLSKPHHIKEQNNIYTNTSNYSNFTKSKNIKTEINVIGLTVEEAIEFIDKFLDDCIIAKLNTARIVHGKGTGKLRNGIHNFLSSHPHVKSFRIGDLGEGDLGVTIVELK